MKEIITTILPVIIAGLIVSCATNSELKRYHAYYQATEILLDSLEEHFNWVDKYDPGEALDNYCNAKKQLNY